MNRALLLEARINLTGASDPCHVCRRNRERTPGMTETYVAGTQLWVCSDCAFEIDVELARFAYDPRHRTKPRRSGPNDHFGVCPECGGRPRWKKILAVHTGFTASAMG
jgi:ribosome-binding protein aMBF1 (putative translation factor)